MARPLQIEYPGAYYHVTSRGLESYMYNQRRSTWGRRFFFWRHRTQFKRRLIASGDD